MNEINSGSLAFLLVLVAIQAFFRLSYSALLNIRLSEIRAEAELGNRYARRITRLLHASTHLDVAFSLLQTIMHFAIAALTVLMILQPLMAAGELNVGGTFLILALIISVTLIVGDIVPDAVGSAYASRISKFVATPTMVLTAILSPITWVLVKTSGLLARLLGGDLVSTVTEEEIMTLVNAGHTGGTIEADEKNMIASILRLDETSAEEVMVPRIDMVAISQETSIREALQVFIESGFSRVPVYEGDIDRIVGILYAKDILNGLSNGHAEEYKLRPVSEFMRPVLFVTEMTPADQLLNRLQTMRTHIAIVRDEYGGTSGLVTIEDLIEEIVGDIRDEYDINEQADYIDLGNGEYTIDAGMDLDDVNDLLGLDLDADGATSLGGYIFMLIGRIPEENEVVETDDLVMRVLSLDGHRIRNVQVTSKISPSDESELVEEPAEQIF